MAVFLLLLTSCLAPSSVCLPVSKHVHVALTRTNTDPHRSAPEGEQPAADTAAAKKSRAGSDSTEPPQEDEEYLSDRAPSLGTSILAAYGSDSDEDADESDR